MSSLGEALQRRAGLVAAARDAEPTTAFRLFNREGDGDAGLAVDVYDRYLVVHVFDQRSAEREQVLREAVAALGFAGAYIKRHPRQKNELADARAAELAPAAPFWGEAAPPELVVYEHGLPFGVRLGDGLRTGLFLDQRDNRQRVRHAAAGTRTLNLFSYTGGFAVAALAGGAREVLCVDSAKSAVARARQNVARLPLGDAAGQHRALCDDAFDVLRRLARRGERFDLIVVDPPSYASTRSRRFRVRRDYVALCRACLAVLAPQGQLLACLNHHGTTMQELQQLVTRAAAEEGRSLVRCRLLPPGGDFPAGRGSQPELKSLMTRVS